MIDVYSEVGDMIQNRLLLSSSDLSDVENSGDHDIEEDFEWIYFVMLFVACLWFIGKLFARFGLPSLVGEILCGIILGPNALNIVPFSSSLIVIGEIGLILLVLEAGIDVSIGHLKVVGYRGLFVAIFGSMLPLGIGTGLAMIYGENIKSAIAIGACLAPTSMGIALNVLRNAKVLNTPTGQLIIAAAVLDDVIALMLLSELKAMSNPSIHTILLPLIISPAFILFFGFLAIKVSPWIIKKIMSKTKKYQQENVRLLLLFIATFIMVPICNYAKSSHLLGAFLAGLMFCTDHKIHKAWSNQIKRIMQWMLRIFFACTIGFAVPIQSFWSKPVIIGGLLYFIAIIGKIATGIFAKPLIPSKYFTIAFSMSAWGEFAFILAKESYSAQTIDKESYSSVLMAVLMSVIISPLLLRKTLTISQKQTQKRLTETRDAHNENINDNNNYNIHPVYFCVDTKSRGKWGHQDKLLHAVFELNLEIIDFRVFAGSDYNYSHYLPIVQEVFYVQDNELSLPPTKRLLQIDDQKLQIRYKYIKKSLKESMGDPQASVNVMRWLPGVRKTDDIQSPKIKKIKSVSYCRKEAYKHAQLALDAAGHSSSYLVSGISRIRPSHDELYRDKFTYHGSIHTEEDALIAMTFIDTLTAIERSMVPSIISDDNKNNKNNINIDELYKQINILRKCVEQLPIFRPALSDDDDDAASNHNNTRFISLQQANISSTTTSNEEKEGEELSITTITPIPHHHNNENIQIPSHSNNNNKPPLNCIDSICDTIYCDEDEYHRPLQLFTNLNNVNEEILDDDNNDDIRITVNDKIEMHKLSKTSTDTNDKQKQSINYNETQPLKSNNNNNDDDED